MKDTKVIFMGTPDFAVPILQKLIEYTDVSLVVTQPDKKVGRKQILTSSPIKVEAEKNNIPVFQPTRIKEDFEPILNTEADIIITCAYGQIIPKSILDYPRLGCINVHASLLPKYRGGAPIHHCLINGEKETGVTIMYMDEKMDSGDIIAQASYLIKEEDNVGTLHKILSHLGANLLIEILPSIIEGSNKRIKQNIEQVTFAKIIQREDERIDFNQEGNKILNQIRGLNPWPLANFTLNETEMKVLKATFFLDNHGKEPGRIVEVQKNKLGISCKNGIIYLEKIKPFGKKEMAISDYLNGIKKEDLLNAKIG